MESTPSRGVRGVSSFYGKNINKSSSGHGASVRSLGPEASVRTPIPPTMLEAQYPRNTGHTPREVFPLDFVAQSSQMSPAQDRLDYRTFEANRADEFSECGTSPRSTREEMSYYNGPVYSSEAENESTLKTLLDVCTKQSADIQKILDSQSKQEKEILELKSDIKLVQEEKGRIKDGSKNISRELSKKISNLHDHLDKQFNPEESSTSKHNKEVATTIIEEIQNDPDSEYSLDIIKLGVKRKYEYLRRTIKEGDSGSAKRMKVSKYDQRKQRAFLRRKSVVLPDEKIYFEKLSKEFMTDESDGDSGDIVQHKHEWRSDKVNKWMKELDRRYQKKGITTSSCTPSKPRKLGKPSGSVPPRGAPDWAICPNWKKEGSEAIRDQAKEKDTEDIMFEL